MNEERVIDVLAHIQRSTDSHGPDEVQHYQGDWVQVTECGTNACAAGWTTLLAGWTPLFYHNPARPEGLTSDDCVKDGVVRDIEELGQELLGLDDHQATRLFYRSENLSDLYDNVARMMGVDRKVLVDKVQDRAAGLSPLVFRVVDGVR